MRLSFFWPVKQFAALATLCESQEGHKSADVARSREFKHRKAILICTHTPHVRIAELWPSGAPHWQRICLTLKLGSNFNIFCLFDMLKYKILPTALLAENTTVIKYLLKCRVIVWQLGHQGAPEIIHFTAECVLYLIQDCFLLISGIISFNVPTLIQEKNETLFTLNNAHILYPPCGMPHI